MTSRLVEELDESDQDRRTEGGRSPSSIVRQEPVPSSALGRKGVQEIALIASDLGYFPKTVFVTQDIPVRLYVTGSSRQSLCVLMDSFGIRKQIRSQKIEEIQFTPATAGRFRFYCPVNGAEGTLVVKEGPISAALTPGEGG
jgi:plastocyanin domain-containing protein